MLKVMIVDDEIIVRVGFQSCINWEAYGCQVVSTCESGGDAVEYMNRDVPDIVFTDIMMPGMDGIQLVKYISENHPDTKVVVLSCVDEIDYVKKAIKLGAEDYILKLSFTQDTLVELITRLKSMIEEERKKAGRGSLDMRVQSFNREEDLRTLLLGNQGPGDNEMLLDRLGYTYNPFETYQAGCFLVDDERMNRPGSGTDSHIRKYGLLNIVREYLENLPKSDLAFTGEHEIVVLFRREGGRARPAFSRTPWICSTMP
ncbi:MAG: response regulator [Enterocloster bolteae]